MKGIPLLLTLCLLAPLTAQAEQMDFGYKTYFKYHPPKEKTVKNNLYPFPGPVIRYGQDIAVCAAARTAAAYAKKTEIKFLSPGKDGWLFRTVDFRSDFTPSAETLAYFKRLNQILADRGQTLVVVFQPPRAMAASSQIGPERPRDYTPVRAKESYKSFLKQLEEAGMLTVDLSDISSSVKYFPKADFHWTPEGADYSAKEAAEVLKDIPAYKKLEKQDFVTEMAGMGPADRGAFEEFIQKTCHVNIELTTEPLWTTHAKGAAADASSLLGDAEVPAVTVLGTSNSSQDDKFNFVGALKRHARVDIYNAAITGGGFGSSAYRYYASDEYRQSPPKIIVWEFLPQHNYNNAESLNAFRQMIPAVYGACTTEKALAEYTGNITRGQTSIFDSIKNLSLKDTYLYLEATEPMERALKVEILYKNGNADQVDLTRSTRSSNNGKYFLELGDDQDKNALLVHVITDKPEGRLTARLCQYPLHIAEK